MLEAVVVVPCHESMPDSEIEREAAVIRKTLAAAPTAAQRLATRMDAKLLA